MTIRLAIITAMAASSFMFAKQSHAVVLTFQENGNNVNLGPTSTFTTGGLSLTASGFFTTGGSTDLYAKNSGGVGGSSETGLGTASDPTGNHEITTGDFIQLTLPTTPASHLQSVFLTSVQSGESANVYFTTRPGTLSGATLIGTVSNADGSVAIPNVRRGFIDITATRKNVLLSSVVVNNTVPDRGDTVVLLGLALTCLAVLLRVAPNTLHCKNSI